MVRRTEVRSIGNFLGNRLLVIGAHPDDCELIAGGLLLRWPRPKKAVVVTTMAATRPAKQATREREIGRAMKTLGIRDFEIGPMPDGDIVHDAGLTRYFELLFKEFQPTLVVTHKADDFHQDHRAISQAVEAALRRSHATLLQGESYLWPIPTPSLYCDITAQMATKVKALRAYESIIASGTFDPAAVKTFHRMRGTQTFRFEYAEAFRVVKAYAPGPRASRGKVPGRSRSPPR